MNGGIIILSTDELTQIHIGFEGIKQLSHENIGFIVKPILISYMIRTKLSFKESIEWRKYVYAQYKAVYHEISWSNKVPFIGIYRIVRILFRGG